ncbi:MAG: hypothetical protein K8F36_10345 [Melioribacteraceae bacterium]|nr:hypothetical protein [Melioribacteraceae bacterium]
MFRKIVIIFSFKILLASTLIYGQCPTVPDILDHGYNVGSDPVQPTRSNRDEIGIFSTTPFLVKFGTYPPVMSFPIIPASQCTTEYIYYQSIDTELESSSTAGAGGADGPLAEFLPYHNWHTIKIFDLTGVGITVDTYPPTGADFSGGTYIPDYIMNTDGTKHAMQWDESEFPNWEWEDFVNNIQPYTTNFSVEILGPDYVGYQREGIFTANINGGNGNYSIKWDYQILPDQTWIEGADKRPSEYFLINGKKYYFCPDEAELPSGSLNVYKKKIQFLDKDINIRVAVSALNQSGELVDEVIAEKLVYAKTDIQLINAIAGVETIGGLKVNETESIASGDKLEIDNTEYQITQKIRTDVLPFYYETSILEKHKLWELGENLFQETLNYSFNVLNSTPSRLISNFSSTKSATIKTSIEATDYSGGVIQFYDPWYYYENPDGSWSQADANEFMQYNSPLSLNNNSQSSYGGIFLDQDYNLINVPAYSIKTTSTQTNISVNGNNHKSYFQHWRSIPYGSITFEDSTQLETRIIFNEDGATAEAILKSVDLSNDAYAMGNNNQAKIIRIGTSSTGTLFKVYESMDCVWLEKSTNNGVSWELMNDGKPHQHFL